jgi:hypothetical protein
MTRKMPTLKNVTAALPAVQEAIRAEIAQRIAAGEAIASVDVAQERQTRTHDHSAREKGRQRKSAA